MMAIAPFVFLLELLALTGAGGVVKGHGRQSVLEFLIGMFQKTMSSLPH